MHGANYNGGYIIIDFKRMSMFRAGNGSPSLMTKPEGATTKIDGAYEQAYNAFLSKKVAVLQNLPFLTGGEISLVAERISTGRLISSSTKYVKIYVGFGDSYAIIMIYEDDIVAYWSKSYLGNIIPTVAQLYDTNKYKLPNNTYTYNGLMFSIATGATTATGSYSLRSGSSTNKIKASMWLTQPAQCIMRHLVCFITDTDAGFDHATASVTDILFDDNASAPVENYDARIPSVVDVNTKVSVYSETLSKNIEYSITSAYTENGDYYTYTITRLTALT